jgi:putative transposase
LSSCADAAVSTSESRPHPFSESLFSTLKGQPDYPDGPFVSIEQARAWVASFVAWYNTEHLHSEIRYVTPDSRHAGLDTEILSKRHKVYERARSENPERWSGDTRDWTPIREVYLNHTDRPKLKKTSVSKTDEKSK